MSAAAAAAAMAGGALEQEGLADEACSVHGAACAVPSSSSSSSSSSCARFIGSSVRGRLILLGSGGASLLLLLLLPGLARRELLQHTGPRGTGPFNPAQPRALASGSSAGEAKAPLAGAPQSALAAELPATCASLECPAGYAPRPGSEAARCSHGDGVRSSCGEADLPVCCWPVDPACRAGSVLNFGASIQLHNNLDGAGPSSGEPGITLRNVFPPPGPAGAAAGSAGAGRIVNLELFATSPYEPEPEYLSRNGLDTARGLVRVAVRPGKQLDLAGRFVDDATWRHLPLEPFYLTVLNLDAASLGVAGFRSYSLAEDSEVSVEIGDDGLVWFSAPGSARSSARLSEPASSRTLSEVQRRRALTLLLPGDSGLALAYRPAPGRAGGGELLLAGPSVLTCPPALPSRRVLEDEDDNQKARRPTADGATEASPARPGWLEEQVAKESEEPPATTTTRTTKTSTSTETTTRWGSVQDFLAFQMQKQQEEAMQGLSTTRPRHGHQKENQVQTDDGSGKVVFQ